MDCRSRIDFLYKNFEKNRNPRFSEEHTSGLMALQNKDCIPINKADVVDLQPAKEKNDFKN